jgi:hypothetical protein
MCLPSPVNAAHAHRQDFAHGVYPLHGLVRKPKRSPVRSNSLRHRSRFPIVHPPAAGGGNPGSAPAIASGLGGSRATRLAGHFVLTRMSPPVPLPDFWSWSISTRTYASYLSRTKLPHQHDGRPIGRPSRRYLATAGAGTPRCRFRPASRPGLPQPPGSRCNRPRTSSA